MNLYIVMNDEGTFLINSFENNEQTYKNMGWEVLKIGLAHPNLTPGILAQNLTLSGQFTANKDMVKI